MSERSIFTCDSCGVQSDDHSWWNSMSEWIIGPKDTEICPDCSRKALKALVKALPNVKWDMRIEENYKRWKAYRESEGL